MAVSSDHVSRQASPPKSVTVSETTGRRGASVRFTIRNLMIAVAALAVSFALFRNLSPEAAIMIILLVAMLVMMLAPDFKVPGENPPT